MKPQPDIDCVNLVTVSIPGCGMIQYCRLERVDPRFSIFEDCTVECCILRD